MKPTTECIKMIIVRRLVQWNKWGKSHTENVLKGLPSHLRGCKIAKKALTELVKDRWLLYSIKTGETHYSLNPKKINEILRFYEDSLKK